MWVGLLFDRCKLQVDILDGLVKSLKTSFDVILAKAGIQCFQNLGSRSRAPLNKSGISHLDFIN